MSTTGEPTPIYANRGKGGLPGRSERQQWGRRACIVSQAETADGIILRGEEEREAIQCMKTSGELVMSYVRSVCCFVYCV